MNLKPNNKIDPTFNMSSLTDIVFLLLIFFLLTSSLVSTNALNVVLPNSNSTDLIPPNTIKLTINKNLEYFIETDRHEFSDLKNELEKLMAGQEKTVLVLNADQSIPTGKTVEMMSLARDLNVQLILATQTQ